MPTTVMRCPCCSVLWPDVYTYNDHMLIRHLAMRTASPVRSIDSDGVPR